MRALASSVVAGEAEPLGPGQRAIHLLAGAERVAATHAVALDAERDAALQAKSLVAGDRIGHPVVALEQGPLWRCAAVVEDRIAGQLDLDLALDALHGADEHMVGAVVGRRSGVRRHAILAGARPHGERVAHHHPPAARVPRRDERIGSRFISGASWERSRRREPAGSCRPGGRAGRRTRWVNRTSARRASRPTRPGQRARRCGSSTGTRSRRSRETGRGRPQLCAAGSLMTSAVCSGDRSQAWRFSPDLVVSVFVPESKSALSAWSQACL